MLVLGSLLFLPTTGLFSQYRAAVLDLPTADRYVTLIQAIAVDRKVTIDVEVLPAARASFLVRSQQIDFLVPTGRFLGPRRETGQINFSAPIFPMAFILYTNKDKPVDVNDLKAGNKKRAKIEMNVSTTESFGFVGNPSHSLEASLRKVDGQIIDGLIFSQASGDLVLRKLGLKNIRRSLYANIEMLFGVSQAPASREVGRVLSEGLASLRKSGKFDELLGDLAHEATWNDWQP
jgi:hypothetical protein